MIRCLGFLPLRGHSYWLHILSRLKPKTVVSTGSWRWSSKSSQGGGIERSCKGWSKPTKEDNWPKTGEAAEETPKVSSTASNSIPTPSAGVLQPACAKYGCCWCWWWFTLMIYLQAKCYGARFDEFKLCRVANNLNKRYLIASAIFLFSFAFQTENLDSPLYLVPSTFLIGLNWRVDCMC